MKRKYREAMRAAAARPWDSYVDGVSDDDAAAEALDWHDEHAPQYQAAEPDRRLDQQLPF